MEQENTEVQVIPADKAKIRGIWKITLYLGLITIAEFIIALGIEGGSTFKTITFIVMTLVKAGLIVSEFMHLGHERKSLIYSILVPTVLVMWLILAMLMQGSALYEILF